MYVIRRNSIQLIKNCDENDLKILFPPAAACERNRPIVKVYLSYEANCCWNRIRQLTSCDPVKNVLNLEIKRFSAPTRKKRFSLEKKKKYYVNTNFRLEGFGYFKKEYY